MSPTTKSVTISSFASMHTFIFSVETSCKELPRMEGPFNHFHGALHLYQTRFASFILWI